MGTPKACPVWGGKYMVPARFAAVFDKSAGRWRGAAFPLGRGSSVLVLPYAPPVKPGAFCDPRAVLERREAAIRAVSA